MELKSGKLILTNKRLVFIGTLLDKNTKIEINLLDLKLCSVGVITSHLTIKPMKTITITTDNEEYHFKVKNQDYWKNEIENAKSVL